jgi:hypothetical protein
LSPLSQSSGLKWDPKKTIDPTHGCELKNDPELAQAFASKSEFTQEQWATFKIRDLHSDDFIRLGDSPENRYYSKPAPKGEQELDPTLVTEKDLQGSFRWFQGPVRRRPGSFEIHGLKIRTMIRTISSCADIENTLRRKSASVDIWLASWTK